MAAFSAKVLAPFSPIPNPVIAPPLLNEAGGSYLFIAAE